MSAAVAALVLQLLAAAPAEVPDLAPLAVAARAPARLPSLGEEPDPTKPTWYGWEPLVTDATAAALVVGGGAWLSTQRGLEVPTIAVVGVGVGCYLLCGPGLHWSRGHAKTGVVDFGLRLGLPLGGLLGGGFIALLIHDSGWILTGFGAGVLGAVALDAFALSWEPPAEAAPPSSEQVRLAPFLGPSRGGGAVAGLAGTF